MKTVKIFLATVLIGSLLTSCTNETDTRTFDEFLDAFGTATEQARDGCDNDGEPAYEMIGAKDGVLLNCWGKVFKIYQYESEKAYKQALKDFPIVKSMAKNGLFVAESNSEELLAIFKSIPIDLKSVKTEETQKEETNNNGTTVVEDEGKWKYSEETKTDPMDNTTTKMILASLISDNAVTIDPWGRFTFTLSIRNLNGKTDVLLYANSSYSISFNAGFDGEKTYRVKFDDEAPINVAVLPSASGTTVFFGNTAQLISKLETADKLTIEAEFYSNGKQIITFSTKGLKWKKMDTQEPSNPLLSKYELTWGASIQTAQETFAKVQSFNAEGFSLWEPTKERRGDWEQYTSIGVRVFCIAVDSEDCFYFYQDKLYKISSYDYEKDEKIIYFDPKIEKQVQALQTKK